MCNKRLIYFMYTWSIYNICCLHVSICCIASIACMCIIWFYCRNIKSQKAPSKEKARAPPVPLKDRKKAKTTPKENETKDAKDEEDVGEEEPQEDEPEKPKRGNKARAKAKAKAKSSSSKGGKTKKITAKWFVKYGFWKCSMISMIYHILRLYIYFLIPWAWDPASRICWPRFPSGLVGYHFERLSAVSGKGWKMHCNAHFALSCLNLLHSFACTDIYIYIDISIYIVVITSDDSSQVNLVASWPKMFVMTSSILYGLPFH